jgi:hypothetical protein
VSAEAVVDWGEIEGGGIRGEAFQPWSMETSDHLLGRGDLVIRNIPKPKADEVSGRQEQSPQCRKQDAIQREVLQTRG